MKVNRSKFIRKYLKFYRMNHGIKPPYHVILDGNFIHAALKYKLDIFARLSALLQIDVNKLKVYVSRSSIKELLEAGPVASQAYEFATSRCEILDYDSINKTNSTINTDTASNINNNESYDDNFLNMLRTCVNNKEKDAVHYMVATQDKKLRSRSASIPGVPTIYLNKVTMILEAPSANSRHASTQQNDTNNAVNNDEQELLSRLEDKKRKQDEKNGTKDTNENLQERKKKKASAPNPLSMKGADVTSNSTQRKKRDKYRR